MTSKTARPNRLLDETSPYLLQHAYNPVDWYPWGEEAFARARDEDKPVLVSIGYSACHWCHVMEHESFEDEATAAVMNEHFVNIKVDMEERPDVDQIYMNFVQLTTGRGGWPMNVFLTPDKRPFFGGTYFPPQPRYGMPSWTQILLSIAEAYRERRDEIYHSANEIVGELRRMNIAEGSQVDAGLVDAAFASFSRTFDSVNGGFGGAPKFPPSMSLEFLLRYHRRTGNEKALEMVIHTLDRMAAGGIYDQLGGGFHRYSVDAVWLVPHFEKMLYDNAQLVRIYLHAYQVTGNEEFKRIVVETLEYVRREMLDPCGAFYSTQDADSEGEEGKFFVWTPEDVDAILGVKEGAVFRSYFDITEAGNFEGKNIPNRPRSIGATLSQLGVSEAELADILRRGRERLFAAREKRIKPGRDEKVLTAWNGLMLAAFADAAAVLGRADYLEIARKNADFVMTGLTREGRLLRTWKAGQAKLNAYLEDYANVADGLIRLFEVSGEIKYFREARRLADLIITEFWDDENGGFFFTSNDHEELIVRNKDFYDNATPSGNSVATDVLLRLSKFTSDERYERFAVATMRVAGSMARRHPQGFGRLLSAMEFYLFPTREIALVGPRSSDMERALFRKYLPNAVTVIAGNPDGLEDEIPILRDRNGVDGLAAAYICENYVCQRPITNNDELAKALS